MAAPTVADYDESTFSDIGTTDEVSGSVSWLAGDLILVFGALADNSSGITLNTPTATGLSFSLATSINLADDGNDTRLYLWTATAGADGSGAVTAVTNTSITSLRSGISVIVCRGSGGLGTPVTLDNSTDKTISVTTTQDNSVVALMMADWSAVNDVTVTATPSGTVRHASFQTGQATFFTVTTDDLGSIGTYACGIASHTGTVDMSGIAVEVKGTGAATGQPYQKRLGGVPGMGMVQPGFTHTW